MTLMAGVTCLGPIPWILCRGVSQRPSCSLSTFHVRTTSSSSKFGIGRNKWCLKHQWLTRRNFSLGAEKVGYDSGSGDFGGGTKGRGGGGGGGDGPGDEFAGRSDDSRQGLSALWTWYNAMLENHPLIAKSVTSALLNALADYICQVFVEKVPRVDWKRFWSFVAIGLFLSGPGLHYWYGALPKIVTVPGLGGVLLRIGLDQVIFTPLGMFSFFVVLLTLENRPHEIEDKLRKDWWPTVLANWKVWIPFQIVNFSTVPAQLQVPAAGLLGMVWSVFISYKGHT